MNEVNTLELYGIKGCLSFGMKKLKSRTIKVITRLILTLSKYKPLILTLSKY